jgi:vancomycin resistance protein VanJ
MKTAGQWALPAALGVYAGGLAALSLAWFLGPERWWWSGLCLYLPAWPWALPPLLLMVPVRRRLRRWVWFLVASVVWVLGPLMGLRTGRLQPVPVGTPLRVMTFNVKFANSGSDGILEEVRRWNPDLLFCQDTGKALASLDLLLRKQRGYAFRSDGQYLVASRFAVGGDAQRSLVGNPYPGYQVTRMRTRGALVTLVNVHLLSPRRGLLTLAEARKGRLSGFQESLALRCRQAERVAADIARETGPLILAGDLNAPPPSLACRTLMLPGFKNAFSEAGVGYGHTYGGSVWPHIPFMRIDHLLVSRHWSVRSAWVGNDGGSEHRPVVADLVLRSEVGGGG